MIFPFSKPFFFGYSVFLTSQNSQVRNSAEGLPRGLFGFLCFAKVATFRRFSTSWGKNSKVFWGKKDLQTKHLEGFFWDLFFSKQSIAVQDFALQADEKTLGSIVAWFQRRKLHWPCRGSWFCLNIWQWVKKMPTLGDHRFYRVL